MKATAAYLEIRGFKVLTAASGEGALQISSDYKNEIHILVTDVVMPQFSGKELVRRIKLLRPNIEVIFISGYSEAAVQGQGVLEHT